MNRFHKFLVGFIIVSLVGTVYSSLNTTDDTISFTQVNGNAVPLKAHDNGDGTYSLGIYSQGGTATLPTGAATSALQTSGNTTLSSITGQLPTALDGSNLKVHEQGTVPTSQSGTWTVQPGNTANTTAWKVDGSAVTQPVSGTVTANPATYYGKTVLYAFVTTSSSGDTTVVAAGGVSNKIKVLGYTVNANGTTNIKFTSGASGTQISELEYLIANQGFMCSNSIIPQFETATNTALVVNNSAAVAISLKVTYIVEP